MTNSYKNTTNNDLELFNLWFEYCIKHSTSNEDLQLLLANRALNDWWFEEYRTLYLYFSKKLTSFLFNGAVDTEEINKHFRNDVLIPLNKRYSKKLMKNARKFTYNSNIDERHSNN